jgi:hypothetical protein
MRAKIGGENRPVFIRRVKRVRANSGNKKAPRFGGAQEGEIDGD